MKILRNILFISIVVVFACDCFEELAVAMAWYFKVLKYGTSMGVFSICGIAYVADFVKKQKTDYLFFDEIKRQFIVIVYFIIVSLYVIYKQKQYTNKTVEEILQLLIPFLYGFFVINSLNFKEILTLMKISLVVSFGSYLLINFSTFYDFFQNFAMISMRNSYSPFESNEFAEIASGLSAFFIYYRKKCPIWSLISVAFVFLTFKRILMLQCFLLIVVCLFNLQDKRINAWIVRLSITLSVIVTMAFNFFLQPKNAAIFEKIFGQTISEFTMGRSSRIWYKLSRFESFGFGSTSAVLGYNLELDLVKILMEIGLVGLILFIWCYFSLGKASFYTYVVVGTMMLNLLFASCLTSSIGWISRIIAIGVITYVMPNTKHYARPRKKLKKVRFVMRSRGM